MIKLNKKKLLNFFFLFTFATAIGQYTDPKPVVVGDTITNNYQIIYPLGWSEDGVFGYIHQDVNPLGAAEIYVYQIVFQNMKTDKIIWNREITYNLEDDREDMIKIPGDETMYNHAFFKEIFWLEHHKEIEQLLTKYNIIDKGIYFKQISDLPNNILLKETDKKEQDITTQYKIMLIKSKKNKQVYQFKTQKEDNSIWYSEFKVKGYFKSPFENRIAIIVFKNTNGYEELWEYPFFVGAELEKGFKDIGCK